MKSVLRGKRIAIVGAGNMGQALIRGLLAAGVPSRQLRVVEQDRATRRLITRRYRVQLSTIEAAGASQVVVVAVKPQDAYPVLSKLAATWRARGTSARPLVISIAAGLEVRALERCLPRCPVIRVMPNLAAKVGCAISAITAGSRARASDRALARAIFQCVGEVVELPERLFDTVTAISGSGPAYFFLIFLALRDAGVRAGVPTAIAKRLAIQTALGSARLADGSSAGLEQLIAQVTSKRGTTEAALRVFRRRGLVTIVQAGIQAAARRSAQLARVQAQRAKA